MSTLRSTIRWVLILVAALAIGGGYYLYSLWQEQDRLLQQSILQAIEEKLPHWNVSIGHARFDWSRRVHVHSVELRLPGDDGPLLYIPEVIVVVDQQQLANDQTVVVEKVEIREPQLVVHRNVDGSWNLEKLLPIPQSTDSLPDWSIQNAAIRIELDQPAGRRASLFLHRFNGEFKSAGKRRFSFETAMNTEEFGQIHLGGEVDLDRQDWTVRGQLPDVSLSQDLLRDLTELSPELKDSVLALEERLASRSNEASGQTAGEVVPAGYEQPVPVPSIQGSSSLDFRLSKLGDAEEIDYKVLFELRQVQLSSPHLPVTFRGVSGKLFCDRRQILIREFSARHGETHLKIDGTCHRVGEFLPASLFVRVDDLTLNDALSSRLPESWQKLYRMLQPEGSLDMSAEVSFDGHSAWSVRNLKATAKNCSAAHVAFPYPLQSVHGTVTQRGDKLDLDYDFDGLAGHRKLKLTGYTLNLGPTAETQIQLSVDGLPIDKTFRDACKPQVRATLEAMGLAATTSIRATFYRPAGDGRRFSQRVVAQLSGGAMECRFFPLRLEELGGQISFNSEDGLWIFSGLRASHGETLVEGAGFYSMKAAPGELDLSLTVQNGHFDRGLEQALPEQLQEAWEMLSPDGKFHCLTKLQWQPGRAVDIRFPAIHVFDGSMMIAGFPVPLKDVEAKLSYRDSRMEIRQFSARHDQCQVRARGFAELFPDQWRVRLEELFVDDLVPDRVFRLALPVSLRQAVEVMNPRGKLSLSGIMDFRGAAAPGGVVTAFWDVSTVFSGGSIWAGMELEQVRGKVTALGTWDGQVLRSSGDVVLDSLEILDHQITDLKGPYQLQDQQLTVGSKRILAPNPGQVPLSERMTARAIGGQLTLDAVARLGAVPSFHAITTMSSGYLEEYARLYLPGQNNLRGIVNGWLDLHGRADASGKLDADAVNGHGQVQISPAALYELPVMVQIFKVLSFVPPDRTAFNYALVDFDLERSAFWFRSIDLVGDAISLRGKGSARLDGRLDLDFYSMLGRNASSNLPVFNVLINTATTGWVGVEVDGRVGAPSARLKVVPTIDDTLRRFLGSFNPAARPPQPAPKLPPNVTQQPGADVEPR